MSTHKPFLFNPDEEPRELLIATFVVRNKLFEKIFAEIKRSDRNTPPQHFLLTGQRGMGKTTLLLRIKYEIEDQKELSSYLIPVRLSEEQYQLGSLPELWEEIALYLENTDPGYKGMQDEMVAHEMKDDYERIAFDILRKKLTDSGKRIVLLIDNIGDLLHKFTDQENHRLREILMTSAELQLVGASAEMLEYSFHYDKPFFEFFYQLKLEPLNSQEALELMRALAKNYAVSEKIENIIRKNPERIEALRRITGGVPRTLVLLFEIFLDYDGGTTFEALEHLADRVVPLYKARMDSLKPQQQKIVDALARAWEAISVSDLLKQSKLYRDNITSNQVSSQLKQLEDNQLVETVEIGKRKKLYRIRERFFNIWYLMRNGRKNTKEQVLWLTRFFESWCTQKELNEMAEKQIKNLEVGFYSEKAAYYKAMAMSEIDKIDQSTRGVLMQRTMSYLHSVEKPEWANNINSLLLNNTNDNWVGEVYIAIKKKDFKHAESLLKQAVASNKKWSELYLASFYHSVIIEYDNAEKYYLLAIKNGITSAYNSLGSLYSEKKGDLVKAEYYYTKGAEANDAFSQHNLAILMETEKKDHLKAESLYRKSIDNGNFRSLENLGVLCELVKKDLKEAEDLYKQAIEKGSTNAIFNLALLYFSVKKDIKKAEELYRKAAASGEYRALHNLFGILLMQNNFTEVIKIADQLLKVEEYMANNIDKARNVIIKLIELGQFSFLQEKFQAENSLLKKYMLPMYYVLAWYMKDELPGEYEKAGSEIKETVDEIIQEVEKRKSELNK